MPTALPTNVPSSGLGPVGLLGELRLTIPLGDSGTVVLGDGCEGATGGKDRFIVRTGELTGVGCFDLCVSSSVVCDAGMGVIEPEHEIFSVDIRKVLELLVGVAVDAVEAADTVDDPDELEATRPSPNFPNEDVRGSSTVMLSFRRLPVRSRPLSLTALRALRSLPLAETPKAPIAIVAELPSGDMLPMGELVPLLLLRSLSE